MIRAKLSISGLAIVFGLAWAPKASAQPIEVLGNRALGMGGAFVAVADDSSAAWWNPAGLAAGPFLDLTLGHATAQVAGERPAARATVSGISLGTPPFGLNYYHFQITDIPAVTSTETAQPGRQVGEADVPVRSLSVNQIGITVLHSVVSGFHIGTTLKYLRGTRAIGLLDTAGDLGAALDVGEDLEAGGAISRFDLDVGLLAVGGPWRVGAVIRNATEPQFGEGPAATRLPRQLRVGAAVDGERTALAVPLIVAVDADLRTYDSGSGDRRVVAVGVERWMRGHRLGLRGGGRFNTAGAKDRAVTAGASVALRSGLYLDGHVVGGGSADDRGWGAAARVSF